MIRMTNVPGRLLLLGAVLTVLLAGCATSNGMADPPAARGAQRTASFSQAQLDQMLAPIALYPDSLLSQVLMASTYPLEVVEAARWSRENPGYQGDEAVRAVQQYSWDPSVKSLVAFPRILDTMNRHLGWTEDLGDAFLAQQAQVMDTVQKLRHKAYDTGNLRSNREIRVVVAAPYIYIYFADPDVVYVPYYDTNVVFGVWWWTYYPPMYWAPWPGYYVVSGYGWGSAVRVSSGFFFGDCDWRSRRVDVVNVRNYYYAPSLRRPDSVSRYVNTAPGAWRHDPEHRRGVPYRNFQLRQEYGRTFDRSGGQRYAPRTANPPPSFRGEGGYGAPFEGAGRGREDDRFGSRMTPEQTAPQNAPESRVPQRTWNQPEVQPAPNRFREPGAQDFPDRRGFQGGRSVQGQPGQPPGGTPLRPWNGQQGRDESQGQPGFQDHPGFQGQPGAQQRPGFQQAPGPQGQSGFQGQSGSRERSGIQGQPGFQQRSGVQAQPGSQERPGFQEQRGSQGQSGFQGQSGMQQQPGFQQEQHTFGQPAQPPAGGVQRGESPAQAPSAQPGQMPQAVARPPAGFTPPAPTQGEGGGERRRGFGEPSDAGQGGAGSNGDQGGEGRRFH